MGHVKEDTTKLTDVDDWRAPQKLKTREEVIIPSPSSREESCASVCAQRHATDFGMHRFAQKPLMTMHREEGPQAARHTPRTTRGREDGGVACGWWLARQVDAQWFPCERGLDAGLATSSIFQTEVLAHARMTCPAEAHMSKINRLARMWEDDLKCQKQFQAIRVRNVEEKTRRCHTHVPTHMHTTTTPHNTPNCVDTV